MNFKKLLIIVTVNFGALYDNANAAQDITPQALVNAARSQIGKTLRYDPSYIKLSYPLGDLPLETGVCSDVVIRALRVFGMDLQKEVSESIKKNHASYKHHLARGVADKNIDHRRVKVLVQYFTLQGWKKQTTQYQKGDILVFDCGHGQWHIAIVSDKLSLDKKRPLIIHNIGCGTREEDCIAEFPILSCFRLKNKQQS